MWNLLFRKINVPSLRLVLSSVNHNVISIPALTKSFHSLNLYKTCELNSSYNLRSELLRATIPLINLTCGFKVKGRLKRRCKDCYFVVREERLYVICKTHPRHKQMAMKKAERNTWMLTDATQSKVRQW